MAGSRWSIDDVLLATGGRLHGVSNQVDFEGVATDSRLPLAGQIFVALKGDRFDAHEFLDRAMEQGAGILLLEGHHPKLAELQQEICYIAVTDTLKALQDMAHFWRKKLKAKLVAITGSNGKTSTKGFLHQILKDEVNVYASPGSFNNHWGVPMSLLATDGTEDVIVLEMGMNHLGEIRRLCEIAEPDVVMVTMVGSSHIGEVGSQAAVAEAKEEIYLNCKGAVQIFNCDDTNTQAMLVRALQRGENIRLFHREPSDKVVNGDVLPPEVSSVWRDKAAAATSLGCSQQDLSGLKVTGKIGGQTGSCLVPVLGEHHVVNLMAASSAALVCGLGPQKIWQNLPKCQTVWGRNQIIQLNSGTQVVFDAYNANPESMAAALKQFADVASSGNKYLILGDMLELGEGAEEAHLALGKQVGKIQLKQCLFIGAWGKTFARGVQSSNPNIVVNISASMTAEVARSFKGLLKQEDLLLMKASRGIALESALKTWEVPGF